MRSTPRAELTPTRAGWAVLAAVCGVGIGGVLLGQNLWIWLACTGGVLWALTALVSLRNLHGMEAWRRLPDELFAQTEAAGCILLRAPRGAHEVHVRERDGQAEGFAARCEPGMPRSVFASWFFAARGDAQLVALEVESSWPMGWFRCRRRVPLPATLTVFPRVQHGEAVDAGVEEQGSQPSDRGTGDGDFAGLRDYRAGDRLAAVHWATTARLGKWVVVERTGEASRSVRVKVQDCDGPAWERALSQAAGAVIDACRDGRRVGLELPGNTQHRRPIRGPRRHRELLHVLATAERRSGVGEGFASGRPA